jgi:hypothetical protein
MPQYASEIGNTSCAATLNKYMGTLTRFNRLQVLLLIIE